MRRSRAPSNWPGPFFAARSWAGCTTNMFGFDLRQAQPANPCRIDAFKAEIAQIQRLNEHIDRANRIVFVNPIVKAFWQQRRLPAIQPRHEARHQLPRRTSKGIKAWQEFSHS